MRFVDLKKYIMIRNRITLSVSLFYGVPLPVLLFLLALSSGVVDALVLMFISFILIFGLVFTLKTLVNRGIEKKRKRVEFECLYLDVYFKGEAGALCILENEIKFHTLTPGGTEIDFDIPLNKDVFLTVGTFETTKLRKLKYGGVELGYVMVKDLSDGLIRQFAFYNVEDVLQKISHRIEEVTLFEGEKDGETEE